jgi:hypothetical protein
MARMLRQRATMLRYGCVTRSEFTIISHLRVCLKSGLCPAVFFSPKRCTPLLFPGTCHMPCPSRPPDPYTLQILGDEHDS